MRDDDASRTTSGDSPLLGRDRVRAQGGPRRWQAIHPTTQPVAHAASSPTEVDMLACFAEPRVLEIGNRCIA